MGNSIFFDQKFFSITFPTPAASAERLKAELLNVGMINGKLHGKHRNECDDLAISLLMGIYVSTLIYTSPDYSLQIDNAFGK